MNNTNKIIFKDNGEILSDFGEQFLVSCPKCKKCANVFPVFKKIESNLSLINKIDFAKLTCFNCGYSKIKDNINALKVE